MHHHANVPRARAGNGRGGGSMGVSGALLELLDVYPQLLILAEAPLTVRTTPLGWKVFTRTEAVVALRFTIRQAASVEENLCCSRCNPEESGGGAGPS